MKPALELVLFAAILGSSGCGDSAKTSASASVSAAPPPPPDCNAASLEKKFHTGLSPARGGVVTLSAEEKADLDKCDVACGGGNREACLLILSSDRSPASKLETFKKACIAGVHQRVCSSIEPLADLLDPDQIEDHFKENCARLKEIGDPNNRDERCGHADGTLFASLKASALACNRGALEQCSSLDGDLDLVTPFARAGLAARGFGPGEIAEVLGNRTPVNPATGRPTGQFTVTVSASKKSGKALDGKVVTSALQPKLAELLKCVGNPNNAPDKGKVRFDLIVGKQGVIAATSELDFDDTAPGYTTCVRGLLQDAKLDGVTEAGRAQVEFSWKP